MFHTFAIPKFGVFFECLSKYKYADVAQLARATDL